MTLETLLRDYGYAAVLVGTFLEGETILVLAGFAAHRGYLSLPGVIAAAFLGTLCGDQLFFLLGRLYSERFLARHPAWAPRLERARGLLDRYQTPVILGFRFLYGLRTVIPFAIGTSRVAVRRFVAFNVAGALLWATAVGAGGYLFGNALEIVLADAKRYEVAAMAGIALAGAAVWVGYLLRRRGRRPTRQR